MEMGWPSWLRHRRRSSSLDLLELRPHVAELVESSQGDPGGSQGSQGTSAMVNLSLTQFPLYPIRESRDQFSKSKGNN